MTPAEQLYGAGSPTSHLACQPGIHRAPTERRFLAVVAASRACPTASVSCWRTLQRVAPRVGARELYFNIERVGNASSASIPLAIHDAVRDRVITRPTRIFAPGFGAGAVAGYAVMRVDPAVIAPDDQRAPTGEVAPVPESLTMAAGADMALAFG